MFAGMTPGFYAGGAVKPQLTEMYNNFMSGGGGQPATPRVPSGRQAVYQGGGGGLPVAPAPMPTDVGGGTGASQSSPMNYAQPVNTQVPAVNMNMGGGSGGGWNQYATQGIGGGVPYWQNAASQLAGAMPSTIGVPPGGAGTSISNLQALLSNPQIRAMIPSNYLNAFSGQAVNNMPRFTPYRIPAQYQGWYSLANPLAQAQLTQMR